MFLYEDFTTNAQAAAQRAEEIMQRYGHGQVDCEHFLLALIELPEALDPRLLAMLDLDAACISAGVDKALRILTKPIFRKPGADKVIITTRLHRVIERAKENAIQLEEEKITGEDLLLAILNERSTPAAAELEKAGLTRVRLSAAMRKLHGKKAR
jgi:ATP-dependent Clp protease ATP-binding subunit ClpC